MGYTLPRCLIDTGADADLMLQLGAVAVAQQLAAARCEADTLRLLLRARASLWKVRTAHIHSACLLQRALHTSC